jgi:hypothetical protein
MWHLSPAIEATGAAESTPIGGVVPVRPVLTPPGLLACTMQTSGIPTRLSGGAYTLLGPLWSTRAAAFSVWKV